MADLVPLHRDQARAFVTEHHRHSLPPVSWKFGVGLAVNDTLVGVGIAGRPVARALDDGYTIEVTRVCTLGDRNANSRIYGALLRAAKALGYTKAVTYTLASESGASARAVGFTVGAELPAREAWERPEAIRMTQDLFGTDRHVQHQAKVRWEKAL